MKKTYVVLTVFIAALCVAACQKAPVAEKPSPRASTAAPAAAPAAPAQQPATKPASRAIITFLSGDVSAKTEGDWKPAEIGMSLPLAASVKTGADGTCELQMGSMAVARISENTVVSLDTLTLESGKAQVGIGLAAGTVVCKVNALTGKERFTVKTSTTVCGVRGTEFVVNVTKEQQVLLGVQKGQVSVLPAWADLQELRTELKENDAVIASLEEQVNETAQVVKENQQVVVRASTVKAWEKALAPIEEKVDKLSARARAGEQITAEAVQEVAKSLEPLEESLAKPVGAPAKLTAAAATTALRQTAVMRFRDIPVEAPPQEGAAPGAAAPAAPELVPITVTAQPPEAEILLNGSPAGKGQCASLFSAGEKVTILVRMTGYKEATLEVTADAKAPRTYSVELEKENAAGKPAAKTVEKTVETQRVSLLTTPADAEILLDGKTVGQGSFSKEYPVGEALSFTIRREGYEEKTLALTVTKGSGEQAIRLEAMPLVRRFTLTKKGIIGRISLVNGRVFAADSTGTVAAAALKGEASWTLGTKNASNETSAPLILGSRLYFTGASEFVIAEATTGAALYRGDLDGTSTCQFGQRVARLGETGLFPTTNGVRLFDLATGAVSRDIGVTGGSMMTPAVWNGKIVTVNQEGLLVVIDPSTGAAVSQIATKAVQPVAVAVQVRGDRGYFADRKGLVVCVDLAGGKVLWQAPLVAKGSAGVFNDVEVGAEGLFAYAKNTLYGLSLAKGEHLFPPVAGVTCAPLYRDGKLYYGAEQSLRIADAATGKVVGTFDAKAKITARPEWLDGLLYLGTGTGEILVVNPAGMR